jgi:hypothetical protein
LASARASVASGCASRTSINALTFGDSTPLRLMKTVGALLNSGAMG